ncbi:MAG: hypothetical protein ABI565_00635 [Vicinamibacteria bacterium]
MKAKPLTLLIAAAIAGCATRGHIATPDEMARLNSARGLSASGRLTLSGPKGRFSARVVFGVARPDALRIEVPEGTGLRFLLVAREGRLRADRPGDDAMFEGPSTREVMSGLFGIDLSPSDLVNAILGAPPQHLDVGWRFERNGPAQVSIRGVSHIRLTLTLDEPEVESPRPEAFAPGPPRAHVLGLREMSERLGLTR